MFGFSHWELLVILTIALLLFGRKLPEVGRSLGRGIIEFKKGLKGVDEAIENESSRPESRRELSQERAYRAPITESGVDQRVSRAESVESPRPAEGHG
jgi:sec-independent protein translocase protein TatA